MIPPLLLLPMKVSTLIPVQWCPVEVLGFRRKLSPSVQLLLPHSPCHSLSISSSSNPISITLLFLWTSTTWIPPPLTPLSSMRDGSVLLQLLCWEIMDFLRTSCRPRCLRSLKRSSREIFYLYYWYVISLTDSWRLSLETNQLHHYMWTLLIITVKLLASACEELLSYFVGFFCVLFFVSRV